MRFSEGEIATRGARYDYRTGDQLRGGPGGIRISAHAIHSRFRKNCVEYEAAIRLRYGVIVQEILQVLADQKHVEELVVDDLEMIDGFPGLGIPDAEGELNFVA